MSAQALIILPDQFFHGAPNPGVAPPRMAMLQYRTAQMERALADSPALDVARRNVEPLWGLGAYFVDPTILDVDAVRAELKVPIDVARDVMWLRNVSLQKAALPPSLPTLEPGWHRQHSGWPTATHAGFLAGVKTLFGAFVTGTAPPPTGAGCTIGVIDVGLSKESHVWPRVVSCAKATNTGIVPDEYFPDTSTGHGTRVCGLIVGRDGLAKAAQLVCATVQLGLDGRANYLSLLRALHWLATNAHDGQDVGCDIINMSISLSDDDPRSYPLFKRLLDDYGMLTIVSAGNHNGSIKLFGRFDVCVAVGAIDKANAAVFAVAGAGYPDQAIVKPDLFAPGKDIDSCMPDGSHTPDSGASFAVPQVAAAAALLLERQPALRRQGRAFRAATMALSRQEAVGQVLDVSSLTGA